MNSSKLSLVKFTGVDIETFNKLVEKSFNVNKTSTPLVIQRGILSSLVSCEAQSMHLKWDANMMEMCEDVEWEDQEQMDAALILSFLNFKAWKKSSNYFGKCDLIFKFKYQSFADGKYSEVVEIVPSSPDENGFVRETYHGIHGMIYSVGEHYRHDDLSIFEPVYDDGNNSFIELSLPYSKMEDIISMAERGNTTNKTDGIHFCTEDGILVASDNSFKRGIMNVEHISEDIDFSISKKHIASIPKETYTLKLYQRTVGGKLIMSCDVNDDIVSIPLGESNVAELDSLKSTNFSFASILSGDDEDDDFTASLDL